MVKQIIDLDGLLFNTSLETGGLISPRKTDHILLFDKMETVHTNSLIGKTYRFLFDPLKEEIFPIGPRVGKLPEHVKFLEIRSEQALDPIGSARKLGLSESDIETFKNNFPAVEHQARVIPRIDFYGTEFHVDTWNLRFQQVLNYQNTILFDQVVMGKGKMFLFYDRSSNSAAHEKPTDKNSVAVAILPMYSDLDPVGVKYVQNMRGAFIKENQKISLRQKFREQFISLLPDKQKGRKR